MRSPQEVLQQEASRLRRFAYSLTTNIEDADDLVHDVALKVLEKGLPDYDNPIPWLLTLTRNLWIDKMRQQNVRQKYSEREQLKESVTSDVIAVLHSARILESLKNLPEKQRTVLSLVALEGLSYQETANLLNLPIGTVMSRVARARQHLQNAFKEKEQVQ